MPDHKEVYVKHADRYAALVACEDYAGHLLPALNSIKPLAGLDVVESGAGTGRLSTLLAPLSRSLAAFDISPAMLAVARRALSSSTAQNWHLAAADHRYLPLADAAADVVISGWSVSALAVWNPHTWRRALDQALFEMRRVLRPGGTLILLETLGTGFASPHVYENLADYYRFLEQQGFSSRWIRTDYAFASPEQAQDLMGFFFGVEQTSAMMVRLFGPDFASPDFTKQPLTVPECTGLWWLGV